MFHLEFDQKTGVNTLTLVERKIYQYYELLMEQKVFQTTVLSFFQNSIHSSSIVFFSCAVSVECLFSSLGSVELNIALLAAPAQKLKTPGAIWKRYCSVVKKQALIPFGSVCEYYHPIAQEKNFTYI